MNTKYRLELANHLPLMLAYVGVIIDERLADDRILHLPHPASEECFSLIKEVILPVLTS